jgi:hypothetical protein
VACPQFYQTPSRLVGMLMKTMADLKLHPAGIQNFPAPIWRWLTRVQDGEMQFETIQDPLKICYYLKWIQHFVIKFGEDAVFKADFGSRPEVKDDEKQIRAEVEEKFREVLSRHPKVVQARTLDGPSDSESAADENRN